MEGVNRPNGITRPEVYAVRHQDESIRAASRSGGIFTALSDLVLESGGIVYGCVLTEDFRAVHIRADSADLRNQMRGSKYIQSEQGDTYKNVKLDLDAGNSVLFSGTSCQIAGLRGFLGREYENLICVDIVCHGVPSKKVWMKYLEWQEKKTGKKIVAVDFRDKGTFGWGAHTETLTMDDGSKVSSQVFRTLFYGHTVLRPCCYECPYKDVMHPGDITIADYWGIEKAAPEFDDNKGVSLVLINTDKGIRDFAECKEKLVWKKTRIEDSMQPPLKAPFPRPANRDAFWSDFNDDDFDVVAKRYGGYGCLNTIKKKARGLKRRVTKIVKG
ncbi:MAG: Coenzyme F420 hydrogenase/dehydrogenase, beta subunit C-terminal domain [Lachnospiraceae bacterium]|nr:Coenzyme F420 hydrogenase/dehydrogenase, beta subunit C-terminal domain [Lachnospiraceae bacterium]